MSTLALSSWNPQLKLSVTQLPISWRPYHTSAVLQARWVLSPVSFPYGGSRCHS